MVHLPLPVDLYGLADARCRCLWSSHNSQYHPDLLLAWKSLRNPYVLSRTSLITCSPIYFPCWIHPSLASHGSALTSVSLTALLVQSILLIFSQLLLLSLCLHYAPIDSTTYAPMSPLPTQSRTGNEGEQSDYLNAGVQSGVQGGIGGLRSGIGGKWGRPFGFWQWDGYGSYLEFLAGLIVILGIPQLILGRWMW